MPEPGTCRSCGKPVLWVTTEATGSAMPLDPDPRPDGNITLTEDGQARYRKKADPAEAEGPLRYVSHYATCPQAGQWRKKNK